MGTTAETLYLEDSGGGVCGFCGEDVLEVQAKWHEPGCGVRWRFVAGLPRDEAHEVRADLVWVEDSLPGMVAAINTSYQKPPGAPF